MLRIDLTVTEVRKEMHKRKAQSDIAEPAKAARQVGQSITGTRHGKVTVEVSCELKLSSVVQEHHLLRWFSKACIFYI